MSRVNTRAARRVIPAVCLGLVMCGFTSCASDPAGVSNNSGAAVSQGATPMASPVGSPVGSPGASPGVAGSPAANAMPEPETQKLKPGEFTWNPERSTSGPVVVVVNLPDQEARVYRNGLLIGRSSVSTGKPGHETPTGVFHILEKNKKHFSSTYNNAPMPFQERVTWGGIALHAGKLPGYPASHGCVRLPLKFSALLYDVTSNGSTVVIADDHSAPQETARPGLMLSAIAPDGEPENLPEGKSFWQPERATEGPVSILVSYADRIAYVTRNGVAIGRSPIQIKDPQQPLPPGVFVVLDGYSQEKSAVMPDQPAHRWMAVGLPAKDGKVEFRDEAERIRMPEEFARSVYNLLSPGTTLMITDLPATRQTTTARDFTVMAIDEGSAKTNGQ